MRYLVEGHWEVIDNLHDVARVINEYYNPELADVLRNLTELQESEIVRLEELVEELDSW